MAASSPSPRFHLSLPLQNSTPNPSPDCKKPRPTGPTPTTETLRCRLLRRGVTPTPKILHALRKKEALKALRRARKDFAAAAALPQRDETVDEEEARFRAAGTEYRALVGRPWDSVAVGVGVDPAASRGAHGGGEEGLEGLKEMLAARGGDEFRWLLDDDLEAEAAEWKQKRGLGAGMNAKADDEDKKIELLVRRLSEDSLSARDWRLTRMMKRADLIYNEDNLLRILDGLEARGNWRQALYVTEWVYNENTYMHRKSRFVYTKLLSILGKSYKATEALRIFTIMRADAQIYPDMPAYHSIAVTLGRAGLLKELIKIIECMRQKPAKRVMRMRRKGWDPSLEPDVLVYNSVLNACVLSGQWKGVFWVFQQIRIGNLPPTGATFGLAMEVMLKAKKYDFVQKFYDKMQKSGVPPRAITYKVLVRCFWEQGKINEAIEAVEDMEQRGVVGAASVYYELACCLCNNGRWRDAILQVEKLKQLPLTRPLEYTFTGMILASFNGGYIYECISIFESMKGQCSPNIGTVNVMLKVYGCCDMFGKAKDLFESTKSCFSSSQTIHDQSSLKADTYTYSSMLEASASAQQWEYFEYVYREMALSHHHLNQSKYSWLIVKACRAGKSYLLEHALDSILGRGEIPDVQLITEMICQSIAQNDYGRMPQLFTVMTEASIKINELEWANLLQQNVHRFGINAFQGLIKYLSTSGTINSDPALRLVKAAQSQCGSTLVKGTYMLPDGSSTQQSELLLLENGDKYSSSSLVDDSSTQQCGLLLLENRDIYSSSSLEKPDMLARKNLCANILLDVPDSSLDIPQLGSNAAIKGDISLCFPELENKHQQRDLGHWGTQVSAIDQLLDSMNSYGDSSYGEMPSASEILELWEQERINDMFAPKMNRRATLIRGQ